ncbi:hypothetical protein C0J52_27072 [Blattella germanica]|nr:hypothetical protein C0J52_27072 [Blattella germanica]
MKPVIELIEFDVAKFSHCHSYILYLPLLIKTLTRLLLTASSLFSTLRLVFMNKTLNQISTLRKVYCDCNFTSKSPIF